MTWRPVTARDARGRPREPGKKGEQDKKKGEWIFGQQAADVAGPMKLETLYLVCVLFVGLLLASCGQAGRSLSQEPSSQSFAAAASPSPRIASTPEWQREGERMREYKRQQNAARSAGSRPAVNAGDFAYQSAPIDITGPGDYTFSFGPLEPTFDYPRSPSGLTYKFPPDARFRMAPDLSGGASVVTIGGQRFFMVDWQVSDFQEAYPQFTAWIY